MNNEMRDDVKAFISSDAVRIEQVGEKLEDVKFAEFDYDEEKAKLRICPNVAIRDAIIRLTEFDDLGERYSERRVRVNVDADCTPEGARELANHLNYFADRAEGKTMVESVYFVRANR